VIVSASRGQYLKPGSFEPGFFLVQSFCSAKAAAALHPLTASVPASIIGE
jgi:hypothetical protein